MWIFGKKKIEELKPKEYSISSSTSKQFSLLPEEQEFLDNLTSNTSIIPGLFSFERKSDGTITVNYSSCFVGKIKLQGRKHWMLIMKNLYDSYTIESGFIEGIEKWIAYIHEYL